MRIAIVEDDIPQQALLVRTLEQQLASHGPVRCETFSDGGVLQRVLRRE